MGNPLYANNSNSGGLNRTTEKRSEKSPDWWGNLQISGEVLEALKEGKRIRLSGWNRTGRYGEFVSLKAELERPREAQMQPAHQGPGSYDWTKAEAVTKQATAAENHKAAMAEPFDDDLPF